MLEAELPKKNQQLIGKLEKAVAITDVKLDRVTQDISEIKNNHLLHINDQLLTLNQTITANQTLTTSLITDKVNEIYSKLTELKINDAKIEPNNNIITEAIKYIIIGVIGAGLVLLFK